ncbi:hypothetical protein [Sphingomonas sp. Leaf4]|uniref:hypothetical protein n=1 Tax=Sphingomonas sp. Leaf4 TaxID=2876553 RepID=UPI001E500688|nr:hypothetical protein [Sphingomonas sp. Leaf4]
MPPPEPTPSYRAWANGFLAQIVPRARDLRRDPDRGAQNRAAALESIAADVSGRLAGNVPAVPIRVFAKPTTQMDLFA